MTCNTHYRSLNSQPVKAGLRLPPHPAIARAVSVKQLYDLYFHQKNLTNGLTAIGSYHHTKLNPVKTME